MEGVYTHNRVTACATRTFTYARARASLPQEASSGLIWGPRCLRSTSIFAQIKFVAQKKGLAESSPPAVRVVLFVLLFLRQYYVDVSLAGNWVAGWRHRQVHRIEARIVADAERSIRSEAERRYVAQRGVERQRRAELSLISPDTVLGTEEAPLVHFHGSAKIQRRQSRRIVGDPGLAGNLTCRSKGKCHGNVDVSGRNGRSGRGTADKDGEAGELDGMAAAEIRSCVEDHGRETSAREAVLVWMPVLCHVEVVVVIGHAQYALATEC